jgi:Ca2+-binding RTX toxin-like protein
MSPRRRVVPLVAALTLLAASPAHGAFPGANGKIAFESNRTGSAQLFTMNATGGSVTQITGAGGASPAWSADGAKIAFVRGGDIYWMYANGTGLTRVTFHAANDLDPAWNAAGTKIAFWSNRVGNNEVYTVNATNNGSAESGLQNVSDDSGRSDFTPAWTGAGGGGGTIAFQSCCRSATLTTPPGVTFPDNNEVFKRSVTTAGAGTGSTANISDHTSNDGRPNWKPDASLVVFRSNRDGSQDVWTMTGNGNSVTKRANSSDAYDEPAYSPDGAQHVFQRTVGGNVEIYTSTEAGGSQANRTNNAAADTSPDWGPADTAAPTAAITSGPSGTVASTSAALAFSSTEDGSTFTCNLDGAGYSACDAFNAPHAGTGGVSFSGLDQGSHTLLVRAVDPHGNQSSPVSRSWTVDTIDPVTTLAGDGPPAGAVSTSRSAAFSFSATDATAVTFECKLDAGAFAPCATGQAYAGLADGEHTFTVRAKDAAGNVDQSPPSRSWTVDATAPATAITSGPGQFSSQTSTSATFAVQADDEGATTACRLDGFGAWTPCAGEVTYTGLHQGGHWFQVRSTDEHGNAEEPRTRMFLVSAEGRQCTQSSEGGGTVAGTGGADVICLAGEPAAVNAGAGNDVVYGSAGDDTIDGGTGADQLYGGPGDDVLHGGAADAATDRIDGGAGADTISGGPGIDRVLYDRHRSGVTVTLDGTADDGAAGENDDVGTDVESITGSEHTDTLTGSDSNNTFSGRAGDDVITGGDSDDFMGGSQDGDHTFNGGKGTDRVSYTHYPASTPVTVTLDGDANDGAASEDDNVGTDVEYVYGTPGDDHIGAPADHETGVSFWGYGGDDTLLGGAASDALYGMDGDDELDGRGGNDILRGGAGADGLTCGDGFDMFEADPLDVFRTADDENPTGDCEAAL